MKAVSVSHQHYGWQQHQAGKGGGGGLQEADLPHREGDKSVFQQVFQTSQ